MKYKKAAPFKAASLFQPSASALADDRVQGGAWAHHFRFQRYRWTEVAADVGRWALGRCQLGQYGLFAVCQCFGNTCELGCEVGVVRLCCQRVGPVAGEPVVAVAVVWLTDFARWRTVVVQNALGCGFGGDTQNTGFGVAFDVREEVQAFTKGTELTHGVPAQVVFLNKLLHVFGRGATGTGFKQAATFHQLHDGEHFGRGAQLEDREEVGQVVAQHVAGDGDAVVAGGDGLKRLRGGFARRHDLEQVGFASRFQRRGDVFDQLGIVGAVRVQPEDRLGTSQTLTVKRQLDPVLDWGLFHGAGAPDVAGFHVVGMQHVAVFQNDADGAVCGSFKRGWVRAVLFGLLRHQTDVGHRACGGYVERAVGFEEVDSFIVDGGVATIRDHTVGVPFVACFVPAFAACADHSWHGGVDDHIGRHVQVGDAFVAVDHVHGRAGQSGDLGFDGIGVVERVDRGQNSTQTRVRGTTGCCNRFAVCVPNRAQPCFYRVAKDDRVRDLHHGGFHVQGEHGAVGFGVFNRVCEEGAQRFGRHEGGVCDGASSQRVAVLEHGRGPVFANKFDLRITGLRLGDGGGFFVGVEVVARHGADFGLGGALPCTHGVWVVLSEVFHRACGATVRVAFTQHRVHGGAFDALKARADGFFFVRLRVFRVRRDVVALALQLFDRRNQLWHGGGDVWQFDNVGVWGFHQLAQRRQFIGLTLISGQVFREGGDDATGKGNVRRANGDTSGGHKLANDRQEGGGGQLRRFVYNGIQYVGRFFISHVSHYLFCVRGVL
mmetsp:Transcript_23326/g.40537  ORF Transcript_23326/g.40537 Transcript_23326/m.40537 type:complete len:773 (-) Transcript_23326:1760-4078(-)